MIARTSAGLRSTAPRYDGHSHIPPAPLCRRLRAKLPYQTGKPSSKYAPSGQLLCCPESVLDKDSFACPEGGLQAGTTDPSAKHYGGSVAKFLNGGTGSAIKNRLRQPTNRIAALDAIWHGPSVGICESCA